MVMIAFHTDWMDRYDRDLETVPPESRIKAAYGHVGEMYNFRNERGRCYGYIRLNGNLTLTEADSTSPVTVVWTAPQRNGDQRGICIVGVYRNATVFREDQEPEGDLARQRHFRFRGTDYHTPYRASAPAEKCFLVSPDARPTFGPPVFRRNWPGQSAVFYPERGGREEAHAALVEGLADLERRHLLQPIQQAPRHPGVRWPDIQRRHDIEWAAMDAVRDHFEERGYRVTPVPEQNLGYDMIVEGHGEVLHVEVKGRSGSEIVADLTFNEYETLRGHEAGHHDGDYRVCIVTDALSDAGRAVHHFHYDRSAGTRRDRDGMAVLDFDTRTAARIKGRPA